MQPSAARGLRERDEPMLVEDCPQRARCADGVGEFPAARIEIEREPIRVTHRAHAGVHDVHRDASHPDEAEERFERAADEIVHVLAGARRTQPEPRNPDRDVALREVLPVEAPTDHPVGAALRRERAIAHPWEQHWRDRVVVARDVALGHALIGPPHLVDVRDRHAADGRAGAHSRRAHVHSSGLLSVRSPRNAGCRSLPSAVHSAYAICATRRGLTHSAPGIGGCGSNGDSSVRRRLRFAPRSRSVSCVYPVPTLPVYLSLPLSYRPTSSAPTSARVPCGGWSPPMTNSISPRPFSLSQALTAAPV